jgi:uncharacterized protein
MRLNLKDIIHKNGGVIPFTYELDCSDLSFNGAHPAAEPLRVSGEVRNSADVLTLTAELTTNLHLVCDRCAKPFQRVKVTSVSYLLADHLENPDEDEEDIILLEDGQLDLDEVLTEAFILDMDTKNLCSEDCKGLCAGCGVDLNQEPCRCKREIDPRFAVLSKLLEPKE